MLFSDLFYAQFSQQKGIAIKAIFSPVKAARAAFVLRAVRPPRAAIVFRHARAVVIFGPVIPTRAAVLLLVKPAMYKH